MKNRRKNEVIENINKSGISLITLIVTIIIIIILAAAVILTFSKNNPIDQANKAKFIQDVSSFKDDLNMWLVNEYAKTLGEFDSTTVDATKVFGTYKDLKMQEIIKSMPNKYTDIFEIQEGKLVYIGTDKEKEKWAKENEIEKGNALVPPYTEAEITNMIQMQGYIPVASATELNNVRYTAQNTFGVGTIWEGQYTAGLDKKYIQVKDVDLSTYSTGTGWTPIGGNAEAYFTGYYDGNSNEIKKLYIDNSGINYAGVFGEVGGTEVIFKNIYISNVNIVNSKSSGALLGYLRSNNSLITNVKSSGNLNGNDITGGLIGGIPNIGGNQTIINNCSSSVNIVNLNSSSVVGGLIGGNYLVNSEIKDCYATGNLQSSNTNATGGLVGYNGGLVDTCYAKGNINGRDFVGGAIGFSVNGSVVKNCYATGNIDANNCVGGLIGYSKGNLENSYYTGNIKAKDSVGGITAQSNTITNCYFTGKIEGVNSVGGIVAEAQGRISNCYVLADIEGNNTVGGISGSNSIAIDNSYFKGNVKGYDSVGGISGKCYGGAVTNCYTEANSIEGFTKVGGILGEGNSEISLSYSKSNVIGNNNVGGILGQSGATKIIKSYSTGSISGVNNIGGIMGFGGGGTITNCYNKNIITSTGNFAGGLVGFWAGDNIVNSYAVNSISGVSNIGGGIGGPNGNGPPSTSTYWNITTSGILVSAGGTSLVGKTTEEMRTQLTYTGWDFASIWNISTDKNDGYPYIKELESTL